MKHRIFFILLLVATLTVGAVTSTSQAESEEITLATLHQEVLTLRTQLTETQEELARVRRDLRDIEWLCDDIESLCSDILDQLE